MAQSKQQIVQLLNQANTEPRYRFGQNFMIDQNLVRLVADAGQIESDDLVIEVGPGTGTLTDELLARAGKVIAVEIDRDLAGLLREQLADRANFKLIEGDALAGKHDVHPELLAEIKAAQAANQKVRLVANLPYNIASPLIIELLIDGVQTLAFTVQKEVGDRLRAGVGDELYGPLSVVAQMLSKVELLRTLPPQAFWPPPKIDSALMRMTLENRLGDRAQEFSTFVHSVFAYRRKTLRKAFKEAGLNSEIPSQCGFDETKRPEEFSPEQWMAMFQKLPGD